MLCAWIGMWELFIVSTTIPFVVLPQRPSAGPLGGGVRSRVSFFDWGCLATRTVSCNQDQNMKGEDAIVYTRMSGLTRLYCRFLGANCVCKREIYVDGACSCSTSGSTTSVFRDSFYSKHCCDLNRFSSLRFSIRVSAHGVCLYEPVILWTIVFKVCQILYI